MARMWRVRKRLLDARGSEGRFFAGDLIIIFAAIAITWPRLCFQQLIGSW